MCLSKIKCKNQSTQVKYIGKDSLYLSQIGLIDK